MRNCYKSFLALTAGLLITSAVSAQEVTIGLTGTFTGPNAPNGISYRNAAEVFPTKFGDVAVKWIVVDDATDPTTAVKNARKFVEQDKVDIILGSTSSVTTASMTNIAIEAKTPLIALSPIRVADSDLPWIFNLAQPVPVMVAAIIDDMKKKGLRKVAFIGFGDGWGDLNYDALKPLAERAGIELVASERYNRTDASVTAQALKVMAADPDAVFVGAVGSAATLPHLTLKDQGFAGPIYHTHGTVTQRFIEAGGKAVEGALMPTGPVVAATELPDSNPIRAVSLDFIKQYEAKWGKGSANPVAGYAWDAMLLVKDAIGVAVKTAKPGTPEFRVAIRDALQSGKEVAGTNAIYRYTDKDHYGVDQRSRVLIVVKDGAFRLAR